MFISRIDLQRILCREKRDLRRFAKQYNLPEIVEDMIDLSVVIPRLHDIIDSLTATRIPGDPNEGKANAERRAAIARADTLELEAKEKIASVIEYVIVETSFRMIADAIRKLRDPLERESGTAAVELLDETLEELDQDIENFRITCRGPEAIEGAMS